MAQTIEHIVDPNDPSLTSEMVQFPGTAGNVSAYVSRPKDGKNLGTVIVIHENRGLVNHIKDVARHFAKDGFAAIAVDCMGRIGGSDQYNGSDAATEAIQESDRRNGCGRSNRGAELHEEAELRQRQGRRRRLLLGRRPIP